MDEIHERPAEKHACVNLNETKTNDTGGAAAAAAHHARTAAASPGPGIHVYVLPSKEKFRM